jgi:hypothetical protein
LHCRNTPARPKAWERRKLCRTLAVSSLRALHFRPRATLMQLCPMRAYGAKRLSVTLWS